MRLQNLKPICFLFTLLMMASACTTSNVLTVHEAGNYTANVNPYGSSGQ